MNILRDAGNNEKRCIIREVLGYYGSIITFGVYIHPSSKSKKIPKDDLIKALKACLAQHPALCTTIQDSESQCPRLATESSIDLEQHLRIAGETTPKDADLRKFLEAIHNEPLPDPQARPRWRVHVAPLSSASFGFLLAFESSHNIFDGKSGMIFHRTFLEALQNVERSEFDAVPNWQSSTKNLLPPPLESAGKLTISWSFLLGPLFNEYLPASLVSMLGMKQANSENTWCGAANLPAKPEDGKLLRSAVCVSSVPPDIVNRVLGACRKHQARLTGLLNHLFSVSLARQLKSRNQQYSEFVSDTAIDMRTPLASEYRDVMANYVSVVTETFTVTPEQVSTIEMDDHAWEAVRTSTERLSKASKTLHDQPTGLLRYLSDYRQWLIKNASKRTTTSFSISNLGVFNEPSTAAGQVSWAIADLGFSQSADATGAVINVNVASARGGQLAITASWWPGMLGVSDENIFVEDVCSGVGKMLTMIE